MDIKELVDLCKKGNEQALSLLYKTYSKKMMGICLHYIPDKQIDALNAISMEKWGRRIHCHFHFD